SSSAHPLTNWPSSRPAPHRRGPSREGRSGRARTGGRPRAVDRSAGNGCRPAPGTWACAAASGSVPSWPMLLLLLPAARGPAGTLLRGFDESRGHFPGAEREAERPQERPCFVVGASGGADGDVHPSHGVDPVVVDLGKDQLLGHAERVVAVAVERVRRQSPEVTDTGDGDADQAVEELPHAGAAKRDLGADGVAFTKLEAGDRLPSPGHHRLLTGDDGEIVDRALEQGRLLGGPADAHVDDDLLEPRDLHDVGQVQLVFEARPDLGVVLVREPGRRRARCGLAHRSVPHFLHTRTLRPCSSMRKPMRVGPHVEQITATLATGIGMSLSMMPPCMVARVWRWPFFTRLMPSTMTLSRDGK